MVEEHIHQPDDGRGRRRVFVDGKEISRVLYADTRKGFVRYVPFPMRAKRNGEEVLTRIRRGKVEVRPWDG